jgi:hypothetical protein
MNPKYRDRNDCVQDHAHRLRRNRCDGHPAARGARHDLRHVRAAGGKVDSDSNAEGQPQLMKVRAPFTKCGAGDDDRHVHDERALAAYPISGDSAQYRSEQAPRTKAEPMRPMRTGVTIISCLSSGIAIPKKRLKNHRATFRRWRATSSSQPRHGRFF